VLVKTNGRGEPHQRIRGLTRACASSDSDILTESSFHTVTLLLHYTLTVVNAKKLMDTLVAAVLSAASVLFTTVVVTTVGVSAAAETAG